MSTINNTAATETTNVQNTNTAQTASVAWMIPGILIPLAGWIIGACVKQNNPAAAEKANNGAWIGLLINLLLLFIGG